VAYPNYINYVKRTHRGEIAELMTESAQTLERHYSRANSYANTTTPNVVTTADPTGNAYYTLAVTRTATSFNLIATPIAGTMMAGDMCGNYTLDNTGLRGNASTGTGYTLSACWGR
jgi:type IV pilus assembly protein PilE